MSQFQFKQLADTIESIIGALSLNCGLFTASDYLRKLKILKKQNTDYNFELNELAKQHDQKSFNDH